MKICRELEKRAAFLKKQFREAPEDTPDDVIWEWIKEFDCLMVVLENKAEKNNSAAIRLSKIL